MAKKRAALPNLLGVFPRKIPNLQKRRNTLHYTASHLLWGTTCNKRRRKVVESALLCISLALVD